MNEDSDDNDNLPRARRARVRDRDDDRDDDIEGDDPVEAAYLEKRRELKRVIREHQSGVRRTQLVDELAALERTIEQHRRRRGRDGNVPGDPYHRNDDEIAAESGRLGGGGGH